MTTWSSQTLASQALTIANKMRNLYSLQVLLVASRLVYRNCVAHEENLRTR